MPEKVTCEECGEQFDPRGISVHKQAKHGGNGGEAVADGGSEPEEAGAIVEKDALDEETLAAVEDSPGVDVSENAVTFRSTQEIEVADERMKEELLDELKEYIRGGTLRI